MLCARAVRQIKTSVNTSAAAAVVAARQYASTPTTREAPARDNKNATAVPAKGRRVRKAVAWFNTTGKIFKHAQPGSIMYASGRGDQPFPMNPLFRPSQPLNDRTREEIYKRYLSLPEENTSRKLSFDFGLSVARVEAIIKMKAHERTLAQSGVALQTHFQKQMEKMLGSRRMAMLSEKMETKTIEAVPPYLLAVDEHVEFSEEDAHTLLGRKLDPTKKRTPFTNEEKRQDGKRGNQRSAAKIEQPTILAQDPSCGSRRHRFLFADTSKGFKNLSFVVRDQTGNLRTATTVERATRLIEMKTPRMRPLYKR